MNKIRWISSLDPDIEASLHRVWMGAAFREGKPESCGENEIEGPLYLDGNVIFEVQRVCGRPVN